MPVTPKNCDCVAKDLWDCLNIKILTFKMAEVYVDYQGQFGFTCCMWSGGSSMVKDEDLAKFSHE